MGMSTYWQIFHFAMKQSEDSLHTQNEAVYIPGNKMSHDETYLQ